MPCCRSGVVMHAKIQALMKLRQGDYKFPARLGYLVREKEKKKWNKWKKVVLHIVSVWVDFVNASACQQLLRVTIFWIFSHCNYSRTSLSYHISVGVWFWFCSVQEDLLQVASAFIHHTCSKNLGLSPTCSLRKLQPLMTQPFYRVPEAEGTLENDQR